MTRRRRLLVLLVLAPLGFVAFIALGGLVVQVLWNWLLPSIFGWRALTYWQALGMLALCRILFGGVAVRGAARSRVRGRMGERWRRMTPEERQRFRQAMRDRFGLGPSGAARGAPQP